MTRRGDIFAIRTENGFIDTLFVVTVSGHRVLKLVGNGMVTKLSAETLVGGPQDTWRAMGFDDRIRTRMLEEGFRSGEPCTRRDINRLEKAARDFRDRVLRASASLNASRKRQKEHTGDMSLLDLEPTCKNRK